MVLANCSTESIREHYRDITVIIYPFANLTVQTIRNKAARAAKGADIDDPAGRPHNVMVIRKGVPEALAVKIQPTSSYGRSPSRWSRRSPSTGTPNFEERGRAARLRLLDWNDVHLETFR